MKKFSLLFLCVCFAFVVNAQRTGLWANGGATFSTQIQSLRGDGSRGYITGPYVGLFVRNEYATLLGWEVGLNYTEKGTKFPDSSSSVRLRYIGLYGNGFLNFPLIHNSAFFFGPGIYVANAFSGTKADSLKNKLEFGNQWEKLDIGFEFKAGYTYNNLLTLTAQYDIGITRNYTSEFPTVRDEYNHGRNSSFSITAGLRLARLRGTNILKQYNNY